MMRLADRFLLEYRFTETNVKDVFTRVNVIPKLKKSHNMRSIKSRRILEISLNFIVRKECTK